MIFVKVNESTERLRISDVRSRVPPRSQIKAVIDYTLEHPVVYDSKSKNDFTLADDPFNYAESHPSPTARCEFGII